MASVSNGVTCRPEPLQVFCAAVFRKLGADPEVADEVARHLVRANLSGHDSHGVIRVDQYVAEADYAGGALLPIGGAVSGHKGYGLALACRAGRISTQARQSLTVPVQPWPPSE